MTFFVAGRMTPTAVGLMTAARELGLSATLAPLDDVGVRARPNDVVLPRLDVLPTLDGVEPGLGTLEALERRGVRVLNGGGTLVAAHDKLATAIALGRAGVPHPRTAHVDIGTPCRLGFPVVVKPRFGSWGRDVFRCESADELESCLSQLAGRPWLERHGAIVQELIPPRAYDLRVIVAGGSVVAAVRRVARTGEWRTNIALGGHRQSTVPPPDACALALRAAAAIGGDLVGVDLLPLDGGWVVLELNGCVDFTRQYGLLGDDPFRMAVQALAEATAAERETALANAFEA